MAAPRPQRSVSRSVSVPAPIGGLNARDALAAMKPTDAITLDNFFPTPTSVDLRKGYTNWVTGIAADVESLMPYTSATAGKLFAAAGTAIYDATSTGAVGAAVVSAQTNARWQHTNYGTTGGQFLYCVNGANSAQLYDGTAWQAVTGVSAPIAITGVTTSTLIHVNEYRNRLFFVQKDSFLVWYLPPNSLGGAAASIDLAPLFRLGGYLMAMCTWTIDNASGVNEYAVFISSEGEVATYLGSDPSVAGNFTLVGRFRLGRPIGRRCFVKVGSDIILITSDGFVPLSKALLTDRAQDDIALSDKIVNLVSADVVAHGGNYGWEACFHPAGDKLIFNVPQTEGSVQYQYVMNTLSRQWCRFTNWNANCFALLNDVLYFGGNLGAAANSAYVAKADTGFSDNGAFIFGEAKTAFNYFGSRGLVKRMTMCRPVFQTAGVLGAALGMDMDFNDALPTATPTFSGVAGTAWTTSLWNTFPWGDTSSIKKDWQGITGVGYCGALHIRVVNNVSALQWQSVDYVLETGKIL